MTMTPTAPATTTATATRVAAQVGVVPAAFTPSWRIKPTAAIWAYGPCVYIRWSPKLGLELRCKSSDHAVKMRNAIRAKGVIRPDLWQKTFFPTNQWGTVTLMD